MCGLKGVFLFYVFFLLCTPHNFDEKVWTGGPVMKIMKKSLNLIYLLLESADLWTSSCLSILFLLSTILNFDQKMWTGGREMKISEKNSFNLMYISICMCGYVDKKVSLYDMFPFCYILFTILTKKCGQVDQ